MKKRCSFSRCVVLLSFFILTAGFFSCFSTQASAVEDVRPPITVIFHEPVEIPPGFYYIKDSSGNTYDVELLFNEGSTKFVFRPIPALSNGDYTFVIRANDLVGNWQDYTQEFTVYVPNTAIKLIKPNTIGVSNTTVFDVMVHTTRSSVCKHRGIPFTDFDDGTVKFFDSTGNVNESNYVYDHTLFDYEVKEGFPRHLYVMCKDELGRVVSDDYMLYSDTIPPRIMSTYFDPSPVFEYPEYGDLSSVLTVSTSEDTICKYYDVSDNVNISDTISYASMTQFPSYNKDDFDAYYEFNYNTMTFPDDTVEKTFTYAIQCEDRARSLSERITKSIVVDLNEGLSIKVNSPSKFSSNSRVFLDISTNMRAYCSYKSAEEGDPNSYSDPDSVITSFDSMSNKHTKDLGTKSSGAHTINIYCIVPEGVGFEPDDKEIEYTYTIDTVAPTVPNITVQTPVCKHELSASFEATDELSGIKEYVWELKSSASSGAINNGSTSSNSVTVSEKSDGSDLILEDNVKYYFVVYAVDGAGISGKSAQSADMWFDVSGMGCDDTPPTITVERSEAGYSASLLCEDDLSGCKVDGGSYYGTSYGTTCNTTQYYVPPVIIPLFKTITICWSIKDEANNTAVGSQVIQFDDNLTSSLFENGTCPDGIDKDGDGYGERCLLGIDCDDTDPESNVFCANGCTQDMDGDGYGPGCIAGPDCNGYDPDLNVVCPNGCISDPDGDGYGLGCQDGPDCEGTDSTLTTQCPTGCLDDNDGDGYGPGCPAGFDCDGENAKFHADCISGCIQDTDSDGYGVVCLESLDCNGRHPSHSLDCSNGCYFDEDGDGYGFGCTAGLDCNGMHYALFQDCSNDCVSDNDGDGYGWHCKAGDDCNDTHPFINNNCKDTTQCIVDHDGDGYGLGCSLGPDCDDYGFLVTDACYADCEPASSSTTSEATEGSDEEASDSEALEAGEGSEEVDLVSSSGCEYGCTFDEDCDGIPDEWMMENFNMTVCDDESICGPDADPDGDGFTNLEEYRRGTDPNKADVVDLPPEVSDKAKASLDEDGDGMDDGCEVLYGLDPKNPYDASGDLDNDGLPNSFECSYKRGKCVNWLNPKNEDHDGDGYFDGDEISAETDPCDPDSHPSKGPIAWLLMLLGLLSTTGSTGYLIYKKYYLPLLAPKKQEQQSVQRPVQRAPTRQVRRPATHLTRHHPVHKKTAPTMSHDRFVEHAKEQAAERDKMFSTFGAKKEHPRKVMEDIARKSAPARPLRRRARSKGISSRPAQPASAAQVKSTSPVQETAPVQEDYVSRLSDKIGGDYVDQLSGLSKKEVKYVDKLATIAQDKDVNLEEDHVSKLANISKKVADDSGKKKALEKAFKKSDMDKLDEFLSSGKRVDTFIKQEKDTLKSADNFMDELESISGSSSKKKSFDALSDISKKKK